MIRESSASLPSSLHVKFYLPVRSRSVDKTSDQTVSPDAGQPTWPPYKLIFLVPFLYNYRFALHRPISINTKGEYTWTYVDVVDELLNVFRQQLEQPLPLESSILGTDPPFHGKLTISRPLQRIGIR